VLPSPEVVPPSSSPEVEPTVDPDVVPLVVPAVEPLVAPDVVPLVVPAVAPVVEPAVEPPPSSPKQLLPWQPSSGGGRTFVVEHATRAAAAASAAHAVIDFSAVMDFHRLAVCGFMSAEYAPVGSPARTFDANGCRRPRRAW
jgi:hypothetical protein